MTRGVRTGWARRIVSAASAAGLALVGTVISLGVASPAQARPVTGWYMLVNDYYDGGSGVDGGVLWCLSTNAQTSPSGANTHYVYLARCNSSTPAQWWFFTDADTTKVENYQNFGGKVWELSASNGRAFTAQRSDAGAHSWNIFQDSGTNRYEFANALFVTDELSASHNNPDLPGTMNVYTAPISNAPAHVWRYYQPTARPVCTPCGG